MKRVGGCVSAGTHHGWEQSLERGTGCPGSPGGCCLSGLGGQTSRRQTRQDSKNRRSASRQVSSPRSSYWAAPKDSPRTSNRPRERGLTDSLAPEGTQFPNVGGQLSQQQSPRLLSPFPESRAAQPASSQPSPPMRPTTHCDRSRNLTFQPHFEEEQTVPNQTRKQNAGQFPATLGKRAPPAGLEPELLQLFLVLIFPLSTYSSETQTSVYSRHAPVRPLPLRHPPALHALDPEPRHQQGKWAGADVGPGWA